MSHDAFPANAMIDALGGGGPAILPICINAKIPMSDQKPIDPMRSLAAVVRV
jgi:hypothetical protein